MKHRLLILSLMVVWALLLLTSCREEATGGCSSNVDCPANTPFCLNGTCQSIVNEGDMSNRCPEAGAISCSSVCVNPMIDPSHCGGCDQTCDMASQDCIQGVCQDRMSPGCSTDEDCDLGTWCDQALQECAPGCRGNAECAQGEQCNTMLHTCECRDGYHLCGEQCLPDDDPGSCGDSCIPCRDDLNGQAACTEQGRCSLTCIPGFRACNQICSPCPDGGTMDTSCSPEGECIAITCQPGFELCSGTCVSCPPDLDPAEAGCNEQGQCVQANCPEGQKLCDGSCQDCPQVLNSSPVCEESSCDFVCNPDFDECNGRCVANDPTACGVGCIVCPTPTNGQATCLGSTCGVQCDPGYHECSGECFPDDDPDHCGPNCMACAPPMSGPGQATCEMDMCGIACSAGAMPCAQGCCGVNLRACTMQDTQGLITPSLLTNMTADYTLALPPMGVSTSTVTLDGAATEARFFEIAAQGVTGFVTPVTITETDRDNLLEASSWLSENFGEAGLMRTISRVTSGRPITSHDDHPAMARVILSVQPGQYTSLDDLRDTVFALSQGQTMLSASVSSTLSGSTLPLTMTEEPLVFYELLERGAGSYVMVAALVKRSDYQSGSRSLVHGLVDGGALAHAGAMLAPECVAVDVGPDLTMDVVSGMQARLSEYERARDEFSIAIGTMNQIWNRARISWRFAITGAVCSRISLDQTLSIPFRNRIQAGFLINDPPCGPMSMLPTATPRNGNLIGGVFVDPSNPVGLIAASNNIAAVPSPNRYHQLLSGWAALERVSPPTAGNPGKLAPGARTVFLTQGSRTDYFFKHQQTFLNDHDPLTASQEMEVVNALQPWLTWLKSDFQDPLAFAVGPMLNEECYDIRDDIDDLSDGPHVEHHLVSSLRGYMGSICMRHDIQHTYQHIAQDIVSILRDDHAVRGTPVGYTMRVTHIDVQTSSESPLSSSLNTGFDFDGISNHVGLFGPMAPVEGDRLLVSYMRWAQSVRSCTTDADCPQEQRFVCDNGECR